MFRMEHVTASQRVSMNVSRSIKSHGVTVVWLCQQTGIPRTTMARKLSGLRAFDVAELDRIAEALRVPFRDLIAA